MLDVGVTRGAGGKSGDWLDFRKGVRAKMESKGFIRLRSSSAASFEMSYFPAFMSLLRVVVKNVICHNSNMRTKAFRFLLAPGLH